MFSTGRTPAISSFSHRFSTKYFDPETSFYYYGYRFYSPQLRRWLNRDPIGYVGGLNLYSMCKNSTITSVDILGMDRYMTTFSADSRKDQWHIGVAVDTWKCKDGGWVKTGVATFDFGVDDSSYASRLGTCFVTVGAIGEGEAMHLSIPLPYIRRQSRI